MNKTCINNYNSFKIDLILNKERKSKKIFVLRKTNN